MPRKKQKTSKRLAADNSQSLQHHKDIIADCPYDIMCNVLCRLDFKTLCQCMDVSVLWRRRISSVPDIWRQIKTTPQYFWRDKQASRVLPYVSEHVEKVLFENDLIEVVHFIETMQKYKFPRLKFLKLPFDASAYTDKTKSSMRPLYNTISRFKDTLKELDIAIYQSSPVSIAAILSHCPDLTALKIKATSITERGKALAKPYLTLISLEVNVIAMTSKNFQGLIRSLPNLQHLMINSTPVLISLQQDILQYCPRLSIVSSQSFAYQHARDTIVQLSGDDNENQGLQSISIKYIDAVEPLMPLLRRASPTLKHIYMSTSNNVMFEPGWQLLSTIEMPQLTELHIVDYSSSFIAQITSVIRRLPNLRAVNLEDPHTQRSEDRSLRMNEVLYGVLLGMNHLTSLSLTRFDIRGQAFIQLMEKCAASDCFTLLSFVRCCNLNTTILHLAASMQNLRVLNLSHCTGPIDTTDMAEFAEMIGDLQRLHRLRLSQEEISDPTATNVTESLRILSTAEVARISRRAKKTLRPMIISDKGVLYRKIDG